MQQVSDMHSKFTLRPHIRIQTS